MSRVCSVEECGRKHFGLGFCYGHYRRFKLYGAPEAGQRAWRGKPIEWLKQHIDHQSDDCLPWPFGQRDAGYGACTLDGQPMRASRAMCILAHGGAPKDKPEAAHSCGNRICVNPRHLRWSTPAENTSDKWQHGTMLLGEQVNNAKLTEGDVREIRRLSGRLTQKALAERFGVSQPAIHSVVSGKTWRHV